MNRAIFITARLGSSRLPQKHLKELQGMKCIEHVMERAKRSRLSDQIILCTTNLKEDQVLVELAEEHGIQHFCGSVEDKIDRWARACIKFKVDVFATYDADDLLCDPGLIDSAFFQQERTQCDYVQWNESEMICGCFTYVITWEALKRVWMEKQTSKTEMAFNWFENAEWCKREMLDTSYIGMWCEKPEIRLTLDYQEDYDLFFRLFQQFGRNIVNMNLEDVVRFINANPELLQINAHRHLDWKKNQERIINESR